MNKKLEVYELYETENPGQVVISTGRNLFINCQFFPVDEALDMILDNDTNWFSRMLSLTKSGDVTPSIELPVRFDRVWLNDAHNVYKWRWHQSSAWAETTRKSPLREILMKYDEAGEIPMYEPITTMNVIRLLDNMGVAQKELLINNIVDASPYSTGETVRNKMLKDNNYVIYIILDLAYEWNELRR